MYGRSFEDPDGHHWEVMWMDVAAATAARLRYRLTFERISKEPVMAKMIFVNLPVSDLVRSTAFYQAVGGEKNPQFSDDTASCMVFSDTIHVMLMTHDKYRQFTSKKIADPKNTSQVLLSLSADSRDAVDETRRQGAGRGRSCSIRVQSMITTSCTAAASKIPTVTFGE